MPVLDEPKPAPVPLYVPRGSRFEVATMTPGHGPSSTNRPPIVQWHAGREFARKLRREATAAFWKGIEREVKGER